MLASPKPAFARAVLSLTDIGGWLASLEDKQTNFNVQVALRFDFDADLDELARFPEPPWPNSRRCSANTEGRPLPKEGVEELGKF